MMDKIIAIYGPTTSNKLGLALNLTKYLWGRYCIQSEIVNIDARKIYKGFSISQSLPGKAFSLKSKLRLFGEISPRNMLGLLDFKKIVQNKIREIQYRGSLPFLVGGSSLHLLSVLQNWTEGKKAIAKTIPDNYLVLGTSISKPALKRAVTKNVKQMFSKGLYKEFKKLYVASRESQVSPKLLNETLAYRQFLEMAEVSKKSPLKLEPADLIKIEKWIVKDILNYGYHQTLNYKKIPEIKIVRDNKQAHELIDDFIQH